MEEVTEAKTTLRERMRRLRAAIPPTDRPALEQAIEERLFTVPEVGAAGTILLFYSFGSEVETTEIARRLHDEGRRLFLPYLSPEGMETAEVGPDDPLVPTTYGPREPARRHPADPSAVDLVITPGLAFDRAGRRLGYGGGHYDRYLARLHPQAARIGVAFSIQLLDEVPSEPTDQRVHLVVTDTEIVDCRPGEA